MESGVLGHELSELGQIGEALALTVNPSPQIALVIPSGRLAVEVVLGRARKKAVQMEFPPRVRLDGFSEVHTPPFFTIDLGSVIGPRSRGGRQDEGAGVLDVARPLASFKRWIARRRAMTRVPR